MKFTFEAAAKFAQTLANINNETYVITKQDKTFTIERKAGHEGRYYLEVLPEH